MPYYVQISTVLFKPRPRSEAAYLENRPIAKEPKNHGKGWSAADVKQMKQLANGNTPTRVMGMKLGRTPEAVQQKASHEGIFLKPTNQSPYNRRKT